MPFYLAANFQPHFKYNRKPRNDGIPKPAREDCVMYNLKAFQQLLAFAKKCSILIILQHSKPIKQVLVFMSLSGVADICKFVKFLVKVSYFTEHDDEVRRSLEV